MYNYNDEYDFYELSTEPKMNDDNNKKPNRFQKKWAKRIGVLVLSGVIVGASAGVAFQGVNAAFGGATKTDVASSSETTVKTAALRTAADSDSEDTETTTIGSIDVSDIASSAMPSIVSITNKSVQEVQSYYDMYGMGGGGNQTEEVESAGSGIIISENDTELLIVTNYHVIEDADTLTVGFVDGQAYEANVKGTDSDRDLAVIAVSLSDISEDTLSEIKVIEIGDSDSLKVGEQVVAIGNALGYGQSVTTGIVSAKDVSLDTSDSEEQTSEEASTSTTYIQTDAAINPGNSGGALLNMSGQLIGINSAKMASTEVEGMGYAIPISEVSEIVEDLMNQTTRTKVSNDEASSIGISGQDVDSEVSSMYGLPEGVYIASVTEGSAADNAGLKKGYIITKFDGTSVSSISELKSQLSYYKAGEEVEIVAMVSNGGDYEEQTFTVTLDKASDTSSSAEENTNENNNIGNEANGYSEYSEGGESEGSLGDIFGGMFR